MNRRTIVVVEDDAAIRQGIVDALTFQGFKALEAPDGHKGLEMGLGVDCELILLDLMLPGPGGLEILQQVRTARPTLPIIILTARGEEADRVKGLKLGADDYMVKPFSIKELLARIEAVLRRTPARPSDINEIAFPGGSANLDRRIVELTDGVQTELSERETDLLRYLACNNERTITREELLQHVWRVNPNGVETRTIDMHIARLREKLNDDPGCPKIIKTVRGKGYAFSGDSN